MKYCIIHAQLNYTDDFFQNLSLIETKHLREWHTYFNDIQKIWLTNNWTKTSAIILLFKRLTVSKHRIQELVG